VKQSLVVRSLPDTPLHFLLVFLQVSSHLSALGKVVRLHVVAMVGGIAHVKQERLISKAPPIVVATPGR
jgi:superfamily II DNA/RNA helicase